MQIRNFTLSLALCMGLFAHAARAEELSIPGNEQRQGMSYEEYAKHREEMRQRMKSATRDESQQVKDGSTSPDEGSVKHREDSAYGQGYGARSRADERPDSSARSRPERPAGGFVRERVGRH